MFQSCSLLLCFLFFPFIGSSLSIRHSTYSPGRSRFRFFQVLGPVGENTSAEWTLHAAAQGHHQTSRQQLALAEEGGAPTKRLAELKRQVVKADKGLQQISHACDLPQRTHRFTKKQSSHRTKREAAAACRRLTLLRERAAATEPVAAAVGTEAPPAATPALRGAPDAVAGFTEEAAEPEYRRKARSMRVRARVGGLESDTYGR